MTTAHGIPATEPGTGMGLTNARLTWLVLGIILVLAVVPRVGALGEAPLWIDEDLTWLATQGVLETGLPHLPSGALYPRAPLYTYIAAAAFWIGDGSHLALRLPSVLASLGLIFVVFLLGRELGGRAVGLAAAAVVAFSPWDVHYARMARMYELFTFFFVLTVHLAYLGLMRGDRRARIAMLVTAALAVASHQQATTLAAVFIAPVLFPRRVRPPVLWMAAGFLVTGLTFMAVRGFADFGYGENAVVDLIGRQRDSGAISVPILGLVDLNHARFLLVEVFRANALAGVAAILGVAAAGGWNVARLHREGKTWASVSSVVFVAALLANQLFIAALLVLLTVKLAEATVSGGIRRGLDLGVSMGVALAITLGAVALVFGAEAVADRSVIRSFAALPVPWYKRLFETYPFTFGIALAGIGVYYLRALRPSADHRMMFLVAAFAVPLVGQGLIYSPYFAWRYNYYLSPLLVLVFVMSVVPVVQFLTAAITVRPKRIAVGVTMLGVVFALFCDAFDPVEAFGIQSRSFGYNRDRFDHPDVTASYNYDYPNTAAYVAERRVAGDILIVRDPVNLFPYLGSADYMVSAPVDGFARAATGELVDFYLGIPFLETADALAQVLVEHDDVTRWIIYTTSDGEDGPYTNLTNDQLDYLTALEPYRAFTGGDGTTVVVRIPAGTAARRPADTSEIGRVASRKAADPSR